MKAARAGGVQARAEVARLQALKEKESSRWLQVLPTDAGLRLTDLQVQTALQMRLGIPLAPRGATAPACRHVAAAASDGWHALVCTDRSSAAINERHNAVVRLLRDAADRLKIPARVEPRDLCTEVTLRPDIQLDLPEVSLLSDVTISHPCAARWRAATASRGVDAVGDARSAEKDRKYAALAATLDAEFIPFVLYTYGGMHTSALSVINRVAAASDPAVALVSPSEWKNELKDRIAICVQRLTADIVIDDAKRARVASIDHSLRGARTLKPRQRSSSGGQPSPRPSGGQERFELGPRVAELCAPLLAPSNVEPSRVGSAVAPDLLPPPSSPSNMLASPEEVADFVPGTPEMDDVSSTSTGIVHTVSAVPVLPARAAVRGSEMEVEVAEPVPGTPGMDDVHTAVNVCARAMSELCVSRSCAAARVEGGKVEAASEEFAASAV
jgi:hypothetical protein